MSKDGCALCGASWIVATVACGCKAGRHPVCLICALNVKYGELVLPCQGRVKEGTTGRRRPLWEHFGSERSC
jgi:hypothetical protein